VSPQGELMTTLVTSPLRQRSDFDVHRRVSRFILAGCMAALATIVAPRDAPALTTLATGSLVPVSHSISKTTFCAGEPVTATMSSRSSDGTVDRINYVIGGVQGKVVALTYDRPGDYQVLFAASDGQGIDQQSITVHVQDCGRSFQFVTVRAIALGFQNDTFLFTAVVESAGPVGDDNRSPSFLPPNQVAYDWEFGDGAAETTSVPYVKHSYAERDERSSSNSTFTINVLARASGQASPIGRTTVTLANIYKANLNNGLIVPKATPARAVAEHGGYTATLDVNNLEAVALNLFSAIVMPIGCDGTDRDGQIISAISILSTPYLPPGKSSLGITIPPGGATFDTCRVRFEITGESADGRPVVLVAAVFVRDPTLVPGSVDTATPEYRTRVAVVEAAMRALGRVDSQGNVVGTISDAEVLELQLKGLLDTPPDQPVELPSGCNCRPDQVCKQVGTIPVVAAPGHGTYAVKGDVVLLRNPTGEITHMIDALGETWTHTGIMVDGNRCRSDLMGGQAGTPLNDLVKSSTASPLVQFIGQATCSVGSPAVGDLEISPAELYQGSPGIITQIMYESSYFFPFGVYLAQPQGLASNTYSPRWTLQAAANTANGMSQRYGIYGYTDWTYAANQPGTYELSPKGVPNGHQGCSGFVTRALFNTAKTLPNFDLNIYPASVRQNAALSMYNGLFGNCTGSGSGISDHIYNAIVAKKCTAPHDFQCPTGTVTQCQINKLQNSCNGVGSGIFQWTQGLLNQVINCFAFGDVGNGGTQVCTATNSTAWHNPGTGSGTISPQSVYNQMGTKYDATYRQEILYPTIWSTSKVYGCVDGHPLPQRNHQ